MKHVAIPIVFVLFSLFSCQQKNIEKEIIEKSISTGELYEFNDNIRPRWSSFENINAEKGVGGRENNGAKGHPYDKIKAGDSKTLLNVQGAGIVQRMWITINDRSPRMLRALKIEMFWDGEDKPAVSAPFGDFFGVGLGKTATFENALFANPEGRSFNSFVAMPFKTGARIVVTNESDKDLNMIFFDVNIQQMKEWNDNYLYFHCYWQRDTATTPGVDFELLPKVEGKGRFLGTNIGVNTHPSYGTNWWGEGEVKMYLDGDTDFATLVGTGTEDYIGTAWGQGKFVNRFNGCLLADGDNYQWLFYRYHIPDPVFFDTNCRVTIQQMGGAMKPEVIKKLKNGVNLIPVTIQNDEGMDHIYYPDSTVNLEDPGLRDGWTNYYRSDDVSAASYFYLDRPGSSLPALQGVGLRTAGLGEQ
ncbi:MAG: DUF2961 domain-containing protein [Cyclobacteriaceae bacterium]|nr:DUF2961 domain-containing protein [Cyclobacteriaceae bacterium]